MEAANCGVGRARGRSRGRVRYEPPDNLAVQFQGLSLEIPESNEIDGAGCGLATRPRHEMSTLAACLAHVTDQTGTTGSPIRPVADFFRILSSPECCVYQYHLEFVPSVESSRRRCAVVSDHSGLFGHCYVFDGMSDLKTPRRLEQELTELLSQRRCKGTRVCIRVKIVQALAPFHHHLLQLFYPQVRRHLAHLVFVQINKYFLDMRAVSAIPQHELELWQGLLMVIREHENGLLMVADTVPKGQSGVTVLDLLMHILERAPKGYRDKAIRRVRGVIVLTPCNGRTYGRTYRVEDINWSKSPRCSFDTREGPKTYVEYYRTVYDTRIRDPTQPLLVCRPSEKDLRCGRTHMVYLVSELCVLTGLRDDMHANEAVMKETAQ